MAKLLWQCCKVSSGMFWGSTAKDFDLLFLGTKLGMISFMLLYVDVYLFVSVLL